MSFLRDRGFFRQANRGARIKLLFMSQVVVEPLVAAWSAVGFGLFRFFSTLIGLDLA
jgi:hypothetical protein